MAAVGTDLEAGGLGGGGETSLEATAEIKARHEECLDQGDGGGDGENVQMLVMFSRVELTGFVDELDVGYCQTIHLCLGQFHFKYE